MSYKIGMPTLLELRSLDANVAFCKELGLSLIELNMTLPEFLPSSLPPDRLRKITEHDGIEFTVHLSEEVDLASFHDEVRDAWIRNTAKTLKWASSPPDMTIFPFHSPAAKSKTGVVTTADFVCQVRESMS